ncbi:unnamed protein product [Clonostachys rosea f. rosea IK726]|uniref:Uncharacterized protein n=1 Tax=Clonostachys rosea f. rosea IK726 TaxID=1349383 RepID=A0ACA9UM34_BIOOC|nr:unnamed protein product [Clonostachys rosea f. rosea IK726]
MPQDEEDRKIVKGLAKKIRRQLREICTRQPAGYQPEIQAIIERYQRTKDEGRRSTLDELDKLLDELRERLWQGGEDSEVEVRFEEKEALTPNVVKWARKLCSSSILCMLREKRQIQATRTQSYWADSTTIIHSVLKDLLDAEGPNALGLFAALAEPRNSLFIQFAEVAQTLANARVSLYLVANGIRQLQPINADQHCTGSLTRIRQAPLTISDILATHEDGPSSLGVCNSVSTRQPDLQRESLAGLIQPAAGRYFSCPSNVSLPDGSSLPIHYLEGQSPVNVGSARTAESEGAEVGMCLRGHNDCQDLDTSSLGLLSYAADLAKGSPAGANLSTEEMLGPAPRSDIPHGQMGDNEQRQTKIYGGALGTGHIDVCEAVESSLEFEDYFNLDPPVTPPCGLVHQP